MQNYRPNKMKGKKWKKKITWCHFKHFPENKKAHGIWFLEESRWNPKTLTQSACLSDRSMEINSSIKSEKKNITLNFSFIG